MSIKVFHAIEENEAELSNLVISSGDVYGGMFVGEDSTVYFECYGDDGLWFINEGEYIVYNETTNDLVVVSNLNELERLK